MSKTTSNVLRKSYSGIFGNQVFLKNRNGKSIMTIPPAKPAREATEKQEGARENFKLAARYAKNVAKDPEMLAFYSSLAKKGQPPYRLALKDFLAPPVVRQIDASGYHGAQGEKINIGASGCFELASVYVEISDPAGILIETGECVFCLPTGKYVYTATTTVNKAIGLSIKAKATDFPGHTAELSLDI